MKRSAHNNIVFVVEVSSQQINPELLRLFVQLSELLGLIESQLNLRKKNTRTNQSQNLSRNHWSVIQLPTITKQFLNISKLIKSSFIRTNMRLTYNESTIAVDS